LWGVGIGDHEGEAWSCGRWGSDLTFVGIEHHRDQVLPPPVWGSDSAVVILDVTVVRGEADRIHT
jgi:hypothetical protein